MEQTKNRFDNLFDPKLLLPLLTGYFILYGAISLITYYSQFNINIIGYIDFSEIISYFINDIILIIINVISFLVTLSILKYINPENRIWSENKLQQLTTQVDDLHALAEKAETPEKVKEILDKTNTLRAALNKPKNKLLKILIISLAIFLTLIFIGGYFLGLMFLLRFAIPIFIILLLIASGMANNTGLYYTILIVVIVLSSAYFNALDNADKVKKGGTAGFVLKVNDQIYPLDSTSFFIGKTRNYVFIFDSKINKSIAFHDNDVKYIQIPMKK